MLIGSKAWATTHHSLQAKLSSQLRKQSCIVTRTTHFSPALKSSDLCRNAWSGMASLKESLGQGPTKPLREEERIGAHRPGVLGMQQSSRTQPSLRTFDYTAYSYADHVTLGCWLEVLDVDEEVLRVAVQLALLDVVPCKLLHGLLDTFGLVGLIVERAALGHQKVAQAIVASKMAPAQRYIHQQYWKNQREVQKQAQQLKQRMARSLDVPNWGASRTRGRQGCAQMPLQLLQEAMLQPLQSPLACHTSPFSNPVPATAESTPSLLTSLSAGASLDAAHSCQVKDSALGTAVELSRSAACLSLRTAAATQRRLFTDSANLDNDDGVVLNRVNKGSLEHRRVSRCSRDMVSPAVGQRQMSTAALLGAALASQQSLQRLPPAVPHSTMAPITAVLVVMLLAIIAVCATHYVRA